ncbi:ArsR/SmtB family transcription factor [Paenibacillus zanthoxyli]|uniref:ArsR/SmtB family transcription factor n=1 Tax=Paenibacillus zanthoxyli TaxID=369399 RepID=UPI0009FF492F|nr:metalloregulator ArsR/SmtB family transcription factor [Paenibacillus zanthoxyli]
MTTQKIINDELRVKIFKALADETRLDIIRALYASKKEMNCGEVGHIRDTTKSNTSYHLRTLKEAKLIKVRKEEKNGTIRSAYICRGVCTWRNGLIGRGTLFISFPSKRNL